MKNEQVDYSKYMDFVTKVTSSPSLDFNSYIERLNELNKTIPIQRLDTAANGMVAEAGEFIEIVKKMKFQGKEPSQDNIDHMIIELGDIMWYVMHACASLGVTLDEVVSKNVNKLIKRYPNGEFNVYHSEVRSPDDK